MKITKKLSDSTQILINELKYLVAKHKKDVGDVYLVPVSQGYSSTNNKPIEIKTQNPREFLFNFLTNYNYKYYTYSSSLVNILTSTGRARSVEETFLIIQYYYPNITEFQFLKNLYHVIAKIAKETNNYILLAYCYSVKKDVIKFENKSFGDFYFGDPLKFPSNFSIFPIKKLNIREYYSHLSAFWWLFCSKNVCRDLVGEQYKNYNY